MKTKPYLPLIAAACFALGSTQAQQPYTADGNTMLLYHFDQNSGATAAPDSSGNGRNATYGSGTTSGLTSATGLDRAFSGTDTNTGRVFYTDPTTPGTDSFLYDMVNNDFTVEMWVKFDDVTFSTGGNRRLFAIQPTGSTDVDLQLSIINYSNATYGGALSLGNTGALNRTFTTTPYNWVADEWYHIAIAVTTTGGTNTANFYINQAGDSATPTPWATTTFGSLTPSSSTSTRTISFGNMYGNNGDSYFPGVIDEVRVSNIARTEFQTLIPEPSVAALSLTALAGFLFRKKWKRSYLTK
ncbi:MAG: LamG-like jellyroll fold domain-containing protein [Chthoniobacterales bacterium]